MSQKGMPSGATATRGRNHRSCRPFNFTVCQLLALLGVYNDDRAKLFHREKTDYLLRGNKEPLALNFALS